MEVDHYRSTKACYKSKQRGHWAKDCKAPRVNVQRQVPHRINAVQQQRNMSNIVCYYCNCKGHFQRNCPNKRTSQSKL